MKTKTKIEATEFSVPVVVEQISIWRIYDDFGRKGYERVKLVGWPHKDAQSCANSIKAFLIRNRIHTIKVFTKRGEVYLEKVDP